MKQKTKKRVSRFLAFTTTLCLVLQMFTSVAFASGSGNLVAPNNIRDLQVNGVTYYDMYRGRNEERQHLDQPALFMQDAIKSQGQLEYWTQLGYQIMKSSLSNRSYPNSEGGAYEDNFGAGWDIGFGHSYEELRALDYIHDLRVKVDVTRDNGHIRTKSTGVDVANSLSDVMTAAGDKLSQVIGRKMSTGDFLAHHSLPFLTDNKTQQKVVYSVVASADQEGATPKWHYNAFGIAFFDFKYAVVMDGQPLNTAVSGKSKEQAIAEEAQNPNFAYSATNNTNLNGGKGLLTYTVNDSQQEISQEASIGTTETITTSNTIENASTNSFEEMVGGSVSIGTTLGPTVEVDASFTTEQTISTAYSTTDEVSSQNVSSVVTGVKVPAHTAGSIAQQSGTSNLHLKYDCPITLTYKVAMFSLSGDCYDDNAAINVFGGYSQRNFITVFGNSADNSDAVSNLKDRSSNYQSAPSYDKTAGYTSGTTRGKANWRDSVDWNAIFSQPAALTRNGEAPMLSPKDLVQRLTTHIPMSPTGAALDQKLSSVSTAAGPIVPLYPIEKITASIDAYPLKIDETLKLSNIELKAFDTGGVPYYGFRPENGYWVADDASAIEFLKDSKGIQTGVKAKKQGVVKLSYHITEKANATDETYKTYHGNYSLNKDIRHPEIILTIGDNKPAVASIKVDGQVDAIVDQEPINLNLYEGLVVDAYDASGREVAADILWEAQEVSSKGVSVAGTMLTVTKPGIFHVRATSGSAHSDWVTVTATAPVLRQAPTVSSTTNVEFPEVAPEKAMTRSDATSLIYEMDTYVPIPQPVPFVPGATRPEDPTSVPVPEPVPDIPAPETAPAVEQKFSDVPANHESAAAISWATEKGLISGDEANNFNPNDPITKEELATILYRYANSKGYKFADIGGSLDATDASKISSWAKDGLTALYGGGFIETDANGDIHGTCLIGKKEARDIIISLVNHIEASTK